MALYSNIANYLRSATTVINIQSATAPSSGKVLTATGSTSATWQTPSGGTPKTILSTDYTATARYAKTTSGGVITFGGGSGVELESSAAANSYQTIKWSPISGLNYRVAGTVFGFNVNISLIGATGGQYYFGAGDINDSGTNFTFTDNHYGFKIIASGGTNTLSATNANGTTETATSLSTAIASSDVLELIVEIVSTSSVNYYWRRNNGALSSATNHTTNLPAGTVGDVLKSAVNNAGNANNCKMLLGGAFVTR